MARLEKISLNTFEDDRGMLCVLEPADFVDWKPERIYYIVGAKSGRGAHAIRGESKFYVCQKGSVSARFHDGGVWHDFQLHGPNEAIIMEGMFYREFFDFSDDAVLLAVSSVKYRPEDYIYSLEDFIKEVKEK